MEIFELKRNEELGKEGIFALSLVGEPAIEEDAVYFSNEEDIYNFQVDTDKGLMMGPIMVPGKMIYRAPKTLKDGSKKPERKVFFTKKGIETEMSNLKEVPFTVNHGKNEAGKPDFVGGVTLDKKWIVKDKNDVAYKRGFEVPEGTGMIVAKFEHPLDKNELWQSVKKQDLRGFSLEGKFQDEEIDAEEHSLNEITDIVNSYENHKKTLR